MNKLSVRFSPFLPGLLSLIVMSLGLGCSTSPTITRTSSTVEQQPEEIRLFDEVLYDLFQGKGEVAKAQSPEKSCYLPGSGDFRFTQAVERDENENTPLGSGSLIDHKGMAYVVSKQALLDQDDLEVICIEPWSFRGKKQYNVQLVFKESSWDKVHEVTTKLSRQKIAAAKGEKIWVVGSVLEPMFHSLQVTGNLNKADIDWLVEGLPLTDPPSAESRDKATLSWLEKRVEKDPDDKFLLEDLAYRYSQMEKNCKKATSIYEKVLWLAPGNSSFYYLSRLNSCYIESHDYDKAITFYNKLIEKKILGPWMELPIRMGLADVYYRKGDVEKALGELDRALMITKLLSVSYPWLEGSVHKDEIEKRMADGKAKTIRYIEAAIARMKAKEPEQKGSSGQR